MEQLTQELKSGKMEILKVPFPALGKGEVLVQNHYSVISAGTESKTVKDARKGYIAKARSRQKEVKMVMGSIKTEGLKKTYDVVMNKLNAPSSLGYSCAGQVIAIGENIKNLKVGDYVACGGGGAVHADIVSIQQNLCVKVDKSVDLRHAAFTTIAAIAIQGIRQADLRFGENCVVIGLGLIGLLTIKILRASGVKAIGVDIDPLQVELAKNCGANLALNRKQEGLGNIIQDYCRGLGSDAVIITAGTTSLDPVELAGELARKKGKVVIVGAVPTGFSRPNYYKKELDLRMSTSYGPGRYDDDYEQKGQDYPIGYVRFTENRNMQTFVDFLEERQLDIEKLISHEFSLNKSPLAYQMILDKSEFFNGILIKYDIEKKIEKSICLKEQEYPLDEVNVGFIGAGSFAQNAILPRINKKCNFVSVATARGNTSRYVAQKYKFNYCAENAEEVIQNQQINTIFITTRHNLHAQYIIKALNAGKNVFVEKPLAMNYEDLEQISDVYHKKKSLRLMLGFNRRFSPLIQKVKNKTSASNYKAININVNAGVVPPDHWVHDPVVGGGRIIGEVCHFIDLAMYLAGAPIETVYANSMDDVNGLMDTVQISMNFTNGSVASINYFSNGNKKVSKERIEVFCNETIYVIDDFKELIEYGDKISRTKLKGQDKGHAGELSAFIDCIKNGHDAPISFEEIYMSSLATLKTIDSIKQKKSFLI